MYIVVSISILTPCAQYASYAHEVGIEALHIFLSSNHSRDFPISDSTPLVT